MDVHRADRNDGNRDAGGDGGSKVMTYPTQITRSRIEGLVILIVATVYIWQIQTIPAVFQMEGVPGPAAFPTLLGVVFALTGLWRLATPPVSGELPRAEAGGGVTHANANGVARRLVARIAAGRHDLALWVIVLAYLFFMPDVGFPVATAVLLTSFFLLLGERRWPVVAGLSTTVTASIYFGFTEGLSVRLPLGVLGFLLQ